MEITQSIGTLTETSITIAWNCDSVVDYLWYSKDGGTKWTGVDIANAKSGTYTISGLNANAKYNVITRVRRGEEIAETSVLEVKTYSYPYCDYLPNFTIGDRLSLELYNPLGRRITVVLIGADGVEIDRAVTTGENISGFNGSVATDRLYQSIPNSKSGSYSVNVLYDGNNSTRSGGTYTVGDDVVPSIRSTSYEDINQSTLQVTQNNQLIIQNQSTVNFLVSGLSAGAAATVTDCTLEVNGNEYNMNIVDDEASIGGIIIDSAVSFDVFVKVADSRGMFAKFPLSVTMLSWELPTAVIQCRRQNNFYSDTDINVNADYASLGGSNTIEIKCRYKKSSEGSYGAYTALSDGITSVLSLDNTFEYDIEVLITDIFGSTTYILNVPKGVPTLFIDKLKNSVGVNCFPQRENSLEVSGNPVDMFFYMEIQSGTDLNDLTEPRYYVGNAQGIVNCPVNSGDFLLTVHKISNSIMQRIETVDKTNPLTYRRFYYGGSFGSWI